MPMCLVFVNDKNYGNLFGKPDCKVNAFLQLVEAKELFYYVIRR